MKFSPPRRTLLAEGALALVCLVCVALSFPPGRPIDGDEFVQFAFGSCSSLLDAWRTFLATLDVNHGQTGAYHMMDYLLLKHLGASAFWLRFPSLLWGALLFAGAQLLLARLKLPRLWRLWGALAIFCQFWIMDFIGIARVYMPLAGTSVATLAYYCNTLEERRSYWIAAMGCAGILLGALFHPYFSVYWAFSAVFGYLYCTISRQARPSVLGFIAHCNPVLSALGASLYVLIAYPTWMAHHFPGGFDPWAWIAKDRAVQTFINAHFKFLGYGKGPFLVLVAAVTIMAFLWPPLKRLKTQVMLCVFLLTGALGISIFLSYMSYRSHYWILQRQWIASVSIATLATTWMVWLVSESLKKRAKWVWTGLLFLLIAWQTGATAIQAIQRDRNDLAVEKPFVAGNAAELIVDADGRLKITRGSPLWTSLANQNARTGGPVWPVFMKYYSASEK